MKKEPEMMNIMLFPVLDKFLLVYPGFNRSTLKGYVDKPNVPLPPGRKRHGETIGRPNVVSEAEIKGVEIAVREMKLPTPQARQRGAIAFQIVTASTAAHSFNIQIQPRNYTGSIQATCTSVSQAFILCHVDLHAFPRPDLS